MRFMMGMMAILRDRLSNRSGKPRLNLASRERLLMAESGPSIDPQSNPATRSNRPIADIVVAVLERCLPKPGRGC